MAKARKTTKKPTEKIVEVVSTEVDNNVVVEEQQVVVEGNKEIFTKDVPELLIEFDDEFVKKAVKFYFENKDKPKKQETEDTSIVMLDKIKSFEKSLARFQFIPKKMIIDFIKDLKQ